MSIELITSLTAAIGTILAGVALILNVIQLRKFEISIRGNTYQQLAMVAIEIKKLLLQYPDLEYLYTKTAGEKRNQFIFERLIGNYLDNALYQKKHGLIDDEAWVGFDILIRELVKEHPDMLELVLQPNFSKDFREYIGQKIAEREINQSNK